MGNNVTVEQIKELMNQVMHPAINSSLPELGIVKDVRIEDGKVIVTMALPFPNIPIIDQLIMGIAKPIQEIGADLAIEQVIMTEEEKQHFLEVEQANWKG